MCDCPSVDPAALVTDWASGDVVCCRCGVVLEGHILDESPEWRNHDPSTARGGGDKSRAGGGLDRHGAPTGTYLEVPHKRRRCATAQDRRDPRDAALDEGARLVEAFVTAFGLSATSTVAATAKELFEDVHAARAMRSDTRHAMAAAAVYFGCKMEQAGRELRQVAAVCGVGVKALNAATAEYKDALAGKAYYPALLATLPPGTLIDIFLDRLRLPPDQRKRVWRAAQALDRSVQSLVDCGKKPRTICSGILFLALQQEGIATVTKKHITEACSVCQQTLDKVVAHIRQATGA